ncbi:GGDEF domain-containing protein [Nocardia concava]|uniref:GGDEF domain-containing protein n=1 Tax=Nocardia concava TaxID=257281 RepID=UPI000307267B|nr:GGDEF domain-containing protein [Nocardia concava]
MEDVRGGFATMRAWWRDPVDYGWLPAALRARHGLGFVQLFVGAGGAAMGATSVLTMLSPAGPQGTAARMVHWAVAALAVVWALRWWTLPWPSRRESLVLVSLADIAITAACLLDADPVYGSLGSVLLVATGGYIAVFHSSKVLVSHAIWSLLSVSALTVVMICVASDVPLALAILFIVVVATVIVLPTVHFCYWVLRTEAMSDPLTGLLNRRGLDYYLPSLARSSGARMYVISVDLDRFKRINDTYGHHAGNQVLTGVARQLRAVADPGTVIARIGGDEFVAFCRCEHTDVDAVAQRVRRAVANGTGSAIPVTASVGVAVFVPSEIATVSDSVLVDHLLHIADLPMYQAKRLGGDKVVNG